MVSTCAYVMSIGRVPTVPNTQDHVIRNVRAVKGRSSPTALIAKLTHILMSQILVLVNYTGKGLTVAYGQAHVTQNVSYVLDLHPRSAENVLRTLIGTARTTVYVMSSGVGMIAKLS